MDDVFVLDISKQALIIAMKVAAPPLAAMMLTGIVVSILQAATQINEQTLSFIPKIVAFFFSIFFTGPWILRTLVIFTKQIILMIPGVTR
jgi:flagellar biosynthetic protein FliQ